MCKLLTHMYGFGTMGLLAALALLLQMGNTDEAVDEFENVSHAEAVLGSIAQLPCDLRSPVKGDTMYLVIWYKESLDRPIYSYDERGKPPGKGKHWASESSQGDRCYLQLENVPSRLIVQDIKETDAGIYRCRVDFRLSPTRNSKVNLTIILPPPYLRVLDQYGFHIKNYNLGPYPEGSNVSITCVSTGGRPLPRVTWWLDTELLDDTDETLSEDRVSNVLHLERLDRSHIGKVYSCQASNNDLVPPISSSITIDLYLNPLSVLIMGNNRPMSVGKEYEMACQVIGARPEPIVTWIIGGRPLRNVRKSMMSDSNRSISVLTYTPVITDDNHTLICRGTTPPLENSSVSDGWKLNIYYVPVVSLELLGNVTGSTVREGMNVSLVCSVQANPPLQRVTWRQDGKMLFHNASAGTVIVKPTMTLLNVTRARSGVYTCVGSNQEGDGQSYPVVLNVMPAISGVAPYEAIRVKRSPDQKSKRRRKNLNAKQAKLDELEKKKEDFLMDLTLTMLTKRKRIARVTRTQAGSATWRRERRKRLTASNFGMVCTRKDEASCKPAVRHVIYGSVDNEFTRHGVATEPEALRAARERLGVQWRPSGVFIDPELPYLAATPDGLVDDDAIIEVKCPLRAGQYGTPLEAVRNGALPYCSGTHNGSVWLKRRALYHYQIQGQLHITRREKCHFVIYTQRWMHHQVIRRDDWFWQNKMVNKLKRFYLDCLLPEIVDPKFPLENNTDDIREGDFIVKALRKVVLNIPEKKPTGGHSPASRERIMRQFENVTLIMKKRK